MKISVIIVMFARHMGQLLDYLSQLSRSRRVYTGTGQLTRVATRFAHSHKYEHFLKGL